MLKNKQTAKYFLSNYGIFNQNNIFTVILFKGICTFQNSKVNNYGPKQKK